MLNFDRVLELLSELTLLKFFPAEPAARIALAKLVGRMAETEAQVEWLVNRILDLSNEWPGPLVLRQIFCSKFKPQDGIEAGSTALFPEGPPPEKRIEAPAKRALLLGHEVTHNPALEQSVRLLSGVKTLRFPPVRRPGARHTHESEPQADNPGGH